MSQCEDGRMTASALRSQRLEMQAARSGVEKLEERARLGANVDIEGILAKIPSKEPVEPLDQKIYNLKKPPRVRNSFHAHAR